LKDARGRRIDRELISKGIVAKSSNWKGLAQERPRAYRDVDGVADVVRNAGLSTKRARLRPIGVIKG
jgi:tRNA-splicing ligase RtcB